MAHLRSSFEERGLGGSEKLDRNYILSEINSNEQWDKNGKSVSV